MKPSGIITLTTDFGTADGYVGSVKGAILSIHPKVKLIDLSNNIPSYDIVVGAFHLAAAFPFYPKGTIHLAVVDPGVGSARRPILLVTRNHYFVGPDNGLFSLVVERDPLVQVYELTGDRYFLSRVSHTFHGRDLFGPVAAHLAKGVPPSRVGTRRSGLTTLPAFHFEENSEGWKGQILFFDKFGNAFTNIHFPSKMGDRMGSVRWAGRELPLYRTYSEIPAGEPGAIFGSSGFLEIALRENSFEKQFASRGASKGEEILLKKA